MHLTDTTTEHDVHINDRLVGEGLAVFRPDTDEDQATFDLIQLEIPPLEVSLVLFGINVCILPASAPFVFKQSFDVG